MEIPYEIRYRKNAKRIIIRSDYRGGLKITAPYGLSAENIEKIINLNRAKLARFFSKTDTTYFLGKKHRIIENTWNIDGHRVVKKKEYIVVFKRNEENTFDIINEWLKEMAFAIIKTRVDYYSKIMNVRPGMIKIKEMVSIWGSCSSSGGLSFNYLLAKVPLKEIDYVVVHELAHMKYMDHSKKFWNIIKEILPDYKEREDWLKKNFKFLN